MEWTSNGPRSNLESGLVPGGRSSFCQVCSLPHTCLMTEKPRETQAELHVVELKEKVNNSSLMKQPCCRHSGSLAALLMALFSSVFVTYNHLHALQREWTRNLGIPRLDLGLDPVPSLFQPWGERIELEPGFVEEDVGRLRFF